MCPARTMLIGIRGSSGSLVDGLRGVCSRYDAEGVRIGGFVETNSTGTDSGSPYESLCPSNQAVVELSGVPTPLPFVTASQLILKCRQMGEDDLAGLATGASYETLPVGTAGNERYTFVLHCPDSKFARGLYGKSEYFIDSIGLVCNRAVVAATSLALVEIGTPTGSDSFGQDITLATSGSAVVGVVALNGYASTNTVVSLTASGTAGASVPVTITIPAFATRGTFHLSSSTLAAGCARVRASSGVLDGPVTSGHVILTPPAPAMDISFDLVTPPPALRYFVTSRVEGRACFGGGSFSRPCTVMAGSNGTVAVNSSNSSVLITPASVPYTAWSTSVPVHMQAGLTTGCAVITATVKGYPIKKTVFVDVLPQ